MLGLGDYQSSDEDGAVRPAQEKEGISIYALRLRLVRKLAFTTRFGG